MAEDAGDHQAVEQLSEEDEVKALTFQKTIQQHVFGGFVTLGLALGSHLGIFDKMIENKEPMSAARLAEETNCRERYVEELMRMMVCGDIVDFTVKDGTNLYHIAPWKRQSLQESISGCFYVPLLAAPYSKLVTCFQTSGPHGIATCASLSWNWSVAPISGLNSVDVKPMFDMWKGGREMFFRTCLNHIPSQLPPTDRPLESGAYCLDVGCCDGEFLIQLAQLFPNSAFIGIDVSDSLVNAATQASKEIPNLAFQIERAEKLPENWTDKFNVIFMVETLHDLPFPKESLQECYRVLAPGGVLSVVDINITSSLEDQKKLGPSSVITYAFSLYHCLSTSMATPGSEGMGTCVGHENIQQAIQAAGFCDVQMKHIPDQGSCVHIVAQKKPAKFPDGASIS